MVLYLHFLPVSSWQVMGRFLAFYVAVTTGLLISPQPDPEGNKLQQPNSNFCKPLNKNSEDCPSNQVSAAVMTSSSDKKWRTFNCFFQSGRAKDLSAPQYLYFGTLVKKPCCLVDTFPFVVGDNGTSFSDSFEFFLSFIPLIACSLITQSNNLTN